MAMPNVTFIRPELARILDQYNLIRDCIAGETAIKGAGEKYLPMPNSEDRGAGNKARYSAYKTRAVFYNVTRRTLYGLIGQVFMRPPEMELPDLMKKIEDDATGAGVSLVQLAKKSLGMTLAYSRSGLFVDYPDTANGATIEQIQNGIIRPTINSYSPHEIINWRVIERGAEEVLSLVVLYETYCWQDDGFEMKNSHQFRVLRLNEEGYYTQEIWREDQPTNADGQTMPKSKNFKPHKTITPLGPDGKPFDKIPFMFIGSENNDSNVDNPNMYDLASVNVAHYRNSADYEESCFIVGQPTPVVTGLSQDWYEKVLDKKLNFGSRGGIPLPEGADAKLIQATENTMIKEAMELKERQMVALGAKLVEQADVQRTAFETKVEATSEGSILSSTAENVTDAYVWALEWCASFLNIPTTTILFKLNTEFDLTKMTSEEQNSAIKSWQDGAISFTEMRTVLRKSGIAIEDDAKVKAEGEAEVAKRDAAEVAKTTAIAAVKSPAPPVGKA